MPEDSQEFEGQERGDRQKKKDGGRKRKCPVTLRLFPAEKKRLEDKAKSSGLSVAPYLRRLIDNRPTPDKSVFEVIKELRIQGGLQKHLAFLLRKGGQITEEQDQKYMAIGHEIMSIAKRIESMVEGQLFQERNPAEWEEGEENQQ